METEPFQLDLETEPFQSDLQTDGCLSAGWNRQCTDTRRDTRISTVVVTSKPMDAYQQVGTDSVQTPDEIPESQPSYFPRSGRKRYAAGCS